MCEYVFQSSQEIFFFTFIFQVIIKEGVDDLAKYII